MNAKRRRVFAVVVVLNLFILMIKLLIDTSSTSSSSISTSSLFSPKLFAREYVNNSLIHLSLPFSPKSTNKSSSFVSSSSSSSLSSSSSSSSVISSSLSSSSSLTSSSEFDAILNCHNQSTCLPPQLEIKHEVSVYLCGHRSRGGVRFYYLVQEGLRMHPYIKLVDHKHVDKADYIVYLPNSAPWHKTECNDTSYADRLLVLDEFDLHQLFAPFRTKEERMKHYPIVDNTVKWNFMYFKRSFTRRKDGVFHGYPHLAKRDLFPLTYSIGEAYIQSPFTQNRDIEVLCTLRGSKRQSTRLRVQENVQKYIRERQLMNSAAKQLDGSSRKKFSQQYFASMHRAKIVVTVNPANWEGDFRFWEAMSSGALVFVDPLLVPYPHPLEDGKHVVFFSQSNASDLFAKLDYYLGHAAEARSVALRGYQRAMSHHRSSCSIDYILRTAESKKRGATQLYSYTGQHLVASAKRQEKHIKHTKLPGVYSPHRHS